MVLVIKGHKNNKKNFTNLQREVKSNPKKFFFVNRNSPRINYCSLGICSRDVAKLCGCIEYLCGLHFVCVAKYKKMTWRR